VKDSDEFRGSLQICSILVEAVIKETAKLLER
jgi:hypothetical protein